jgi:signal transduction histidine kinase
MRGPTPNMRANLKSNFMAVRVVLLQALLLAGLIGWLDYVTGWEWSFFAPFAVPIVLVTWKTGPRLGFTFAVLCAVTYWLANSGSNPYQTRWGFALAATSRFFYFVILVVAVAMLKAKWELDRMRIATLERMRELELEIMRTSEREQQRIGRDLHDSLAPHLTAVGYAAGFLANELRQHDRPEAAKAEEIRQLVGEAVTLTRKLARGLFPVETDGVGLAIALAELARTTTSLTGIAVSFNESGEFQPADPESVLHLHRIAQEALNNAVKHGGARNVSIILDRSKDVWRLTVADDGKGMAPGPTDQLGMGLLSMRYRARALGGEIKIDSLPGEGTVVSCEIPSRPPQSALPAS